MEHLQKRLQEAAKNCERLEKELYEAKAELEAVKELTECDHDFHESCSGGVVVDMVCVHCNTIQYG